MYRSQNCWVGVTSLLVCFYYANAILVVQPRNTSAPERHQVQLNCSTDDLTTPISWQYVAVGGTVPKDIFLSNTLVNGYVQRFQINGNRSEGVYNLVIPSVQMSDTGTYRCRDMDGVGQHVDASLTITENTDLRLEPEHAESMIGERVQLTCTTYYKTEPVNWQHIPFGQSLPDVVYINKQFVNEYTSGYDAQSNNTGSNGLIITSAKSSDGGLFRCIEQEGRGQHKDAELTVIETVDCRMFLNDTCGTTPQNVTLECSMTFYGNIAPLLQWVTAEGDVIDQGVTPTKSDRKVTSTLIKEIDEASLSSYYTCLADISRASCKPMHSANCLTTEYDSSTHSNDPKSGPSSTDSNLKFLGFLALILVLIIIVVGVCCWRRNKKENAPRNGENARNQHELDNLHEGEQK